MDVVEEGVKLSDGLLVGFRDGIVGSGDDEAGVRLFEGFFFGGLAKLAEAGVQGLELGLHLSPDYDFLLGVCMRAGWDGVGGMGVGVEVLHVDR